MTAPGLLFVYGSLRSDLHHPMHAVLAEHANQVGVATMLGHLVVVDWYPGMVPGTDEGKRVHGELWRVHDDAVWPRLDAYEECGPNDPEPHEYRRRVGVAQRNGATVSAFFYAFARSTAGLTVVEGGDWRHWVEAQPAQPAPSSKPT